VTDPRPIVFMTDYGLADEFVGVCHGVIERICPGAGVIDLTHLIARQSVIQGAVVLGRAAPYMPAGAIHLAVVDPGVGTTRRPVAVEASSGAMLVGPDNGVLSIAWRALGGAARAVEIAADDIVLHPVSRTFHGRDVFAPAAAHLAAGTPIDRLGPDLDVRTLVALEVPSPMVTPGAIGARVVAVDGFGNVQLNATPDDLSAAGLATRVSIGPDLVPVAATFADVEEGRAALIVDAQGFLALVVNRGSASSAFGLHPGDAVTVLGAAP
jgi:S-adenosylmethionine hydrolase